MLTRTVVASLLLAAVSVAHAETQIKPLAISVGSPALEGMDFSLRPGNINAGVAVHVLITGLETPIVDIDDDASTLDKATDSTGKDLLVEPKPAGGMMMMTRSGIGPFPSVSNDGKAAVIEFNAPQAPAKGATSVTFDGKLAVVVATGTKADSANVPLAPGPLQVGDLDLEITSCEKSEWEEGKFTLAVRMDKATHDQIATWKITAPTGALIGEDPNSTMTMGDTVDVEITLESKPANAMIELEVFEGLKKIDVPVKVTVGLGIE